MVTTRMVKQELTLKELRFGPFLTEVPSLCLLRDGVDCKRRPQPVQVLRLLARRADLTGEGRHL